MRVGKRDLDVHALLSVATAGVLVSVAVVRVLSYHRGGIGGWIEDSLLGPLAYRPESIASVRCFKLLATPAFVSAMYFMFRWMNRGHTQSPPDGYRPSHRDIDFESPWVRLSLLAVVNVHWALLEGYKFLTRCYPYSPLESWRINVGVLAVGSVVTFFAMKLLSFATVWRAAGPGDSGP